MSNPDSGIIGKPVKDMYGSEMGSIVGTLTDIDGSIQTVGIDCGSSGLMQVPIEQLVEQGNSVIFIPKWRLDSQRLLREKSLTLRRLRALMEIASENDGMRNDASMVHEKYKSQLDSLDRKQREIQSELDARLVELDEQIKAVTMLVFDARVQSKSGEIEAHVYEKARQQTVALTERITHENSEIQGVSKRLADLDAEVEQAMMKSPAQLQDSAVSYLVENTGAKLPEAPSDVPEPSQYAPAAAPEAPAQYASPPAEGHVPAVSAGPLAPAAQQEPETDWLSRMQAQ